MDHNELEEPHDDDVVEITTLHQDDEEGSANTPRFITQTWLLSPKYRKQKTIAAAMCMGLALLIVLFAMTPVSRLFLRGSPSTVEPSISYFGLDANPPWGSLSVDGKRVALFSRGAYTLFSLPPGQHTLTWHAAPFAPQQCRISVPLGSGRDTCQFPVAAPDLGGTISATIRFPTNVTMLSAGQRTALIQAAQAVLDRQQSSETVQAGEVYTQTSAVSGTNTRSCTVVLQRAATLFRCCSPATGGDVALSTGYRHIYPLRLVRMEHATQATRTAASSVMFLPSLDPISYRPQQCGKRQSWCNCSGSSPPEMDGSSRRIRQIALFSDSKMLLRSP